MEVSASDNTLRRVIEDDSVAKRRYGPDMAKKVKLRIAALRAAESLADFWPPESGPERCHELKANLAGTFSIDLKQPYRILFTAVESSKPSSRSDEQQRWAS